VAGAVEAPRRQRPQRRAFLGEPLGDREAAGRVRALVADPVAPAAVLLLELDERAEPPRRPEAALEVADGRFD
jgi:hypothetical protein